MVTQHMIDTLVNLADVIDSVKADDYVDDAAELFDADDALCVRAAASRLRQTCATCKHHDAARAQCGWLPLSVPLDGSGYCWEWEAKDGAR